MSRGNPTIFLIEVHAIIRRQKQEEPDTAVKILWWKGIDMMLFHKTKTIIIVGASRFGAGLAGKLAGAGTRIVVLDLDADAFRKLPDDFDGYQLLGDGTDVDMLREAGIESASVFIAATDDDNVNILAAQIASRIFKVPEVFSRLNDRNKERLIKGFNIKPICPFVLSVNEFDRLAGNGYQEAVKS